MDLITGRQVQEMLGFEDREDLFAFFKANGVRDHSFTFEEFERGRATIEALLDSEYIAECGAVADPSITLEEVQEALSGIPGSMTDDFRRERDER